MNRPSAASRPPFHTVAPAELLRFEAARDSLRDAGAAARVADQALREAVASETRVLATYEPFPVWDAARKAAAEAAHTANLADQAHREAVVRETEALEDLLDADRAAELRSAVGAEAAMLATVSAHNDACTAAEAADAECEVLTRLIERWSQSPLEQEQLAAQAATPLLDGMHAAANAHYAEANRTLRLLIRLEAQPPEQK